MITTDDLPLERDGRTAMLTVNRPGARNTMTFEMYDRLYAMCDALDKDPTVRVVVLRGVGDQAFASGIDIRHFLAFKTREDALRRAFDADSRVPGFRHQTDHCDGSGRCRRRRALHGARL